MGFPVPVEYAVAVDQYLDQAGLSSASRRVYQISLANWAWPLVGKPVPTSPQRRGAVPPILPLALLDEPDAKVKLAAQFAARTSMADARTANRELSALRSAVGWWREQGWIRGDPTAGLRHEHPHERGTPLNGEQVNALFLLRADLREHAMWRVLHDSGAPASEVLSLDAAQLDLSRHRTRPRAGSQIRWADIQWSDRTSLMLRWLLAGRMWGPVFITSRRAQFTIGARRVPTNRPDAAVIPTRGGDLHHGDPPPGRNRPGLDTAPAEHGRKGTSA